jgi:DNA-binding MarR family transcriptional regulator
MTVSQVVRALEKAGYFTRVAHPTDSRARVIRPTDAGRRLAAKALVAVETTDEAFFAPLRSECGTLVDLLRRLSPGVEA